MPARAERKIAEDKMELSEIMSSMAKMFVCAREFVVSNTRGQTMTEYTLVLAAIAVVVFGVYLVLGNNVSTLASGVDSTLTNA
jgi:Flp pilus assembly pilin Flp